MTAPLREIFKNNASTTLNGAINNSVTSITVTDGSVFPSTGNFRLICGTELMLCTARSSNTLTVVRGVESSSAASHADQDVISMIFTDGGMRRWGLDNNPFWAGSSPPLGKLVADDGVTLLTSSDFSAINSGHTTVSDDNGSMLVVTDATSGANWRMFSRTPPSPTYEYIAAFHIGYLGVSASDMNVGLGFRESGTGKTSLITVYSNSTQVPKIRCHDNTGNTNRTAAGNDAVWIQSPLIWLRVKYDGTNCIFSMSYDGVNWLQLRSVAKTTPFTTAPDTLIWAVFYNDGVSGDPDFVARLCHWSRSL